MYFVFIDELLAESGQQAGRVPRVLTMCFRGGAELLHQVSQVHRHEHVEDLKAELVEVIDAVLVVCSLLASTVKCLMRASYLAE